ncbi:MAG: hypothetical protein Q8P49_02135 [Candidatus Liptonbacteria bacterium]|nr:hypothetical protein [Candidatus Liptonbacteria bacterium]
MAIDASVNSLPGIDVNVQGKSFSLSFDSLLSIFSGPITYFVDTGKQIAGGFVNSVSHVSIGDLGANSVFSGLNDWFLRTTGGISLIGVLRFLGNAIASIFSFFADLIRGLVSRI